MFWRACESAPLGAHSVRLRLLAELQIHGRVCVCVCVHAHEYACVHAHARERLLGGAGGRGGRRSLSVARVAAAEACDGEESELHAMLGCRGSPSTAVHACRPQQRGRAQGRAAAAWLLTCASTRMRSEPKTSHTIRNFDEMH